MCKYCEKLEKINQEALLETENMLIQVDQDTPIGRRRGQGGILRIYDNLDETTINIFYCPMCGRKLNECVEELSTIDIEENNEDLKIRFYEKIQVIKYFAHRVNALQEDEKLNIEKRLGYKFVGTLGFVKQVYDDGRLEELDRLLKEKEGKF